jgi:hypothetical protein
MLDKGGVRNLETEARVPRIEVRGGRPIAPKGIAYDEMATRLDNAVGRRLLPFELIGPASVRRPETARRLPSSLAVMVNLEVQITVSVFEGWSALLMKRAVRPHGRSFDELGSQLSNLHQARDGAGTHGTLTGEKVAKGQVRGN